MTTFKKGDGVWIHFPSGTDKCTADIVEVRVDDAGEVTYRYAYNGIVYHGRTDWTFEPNQQIPQVHDPSHEKRIQDAQEIMWFGTALTYRAPEDGDDEKRALWQAKIKKHEDAIAVLKKRCAHFTKGTSVAWNAYYCCYGAKRQNKCKNDGLLKGVLDEEVYNFECRVKTSDGIVHSMTVWALGLD